MKTYIQIIFEQKTRIKNLIRSDSINSETKSELSQLLGSYEVIACDAINYWLSLMDKNNLIDDTIDKFNKL